MRGGYCQLRVLRQPLSTGKGFEQDEESLDLREGFCVASEDSNSLLHLSFCWGSRLLTVHLVAAF